MEPGNDRMSAAVLHGIRDLRYEHVSVPPTRPDEVLVRITTNGLCGSDIHFFKEGKLGPFVVDRPYIPGHEACGVVVREAASRAARARARASPSSPASPAGAARCASRAGTTCAVTWCSCPPRPSTGPSPSMRRSRRTSRTPSPIDVDEESAAFVEPLGRGRAGVHARRAPGGSHRGDHWRWSHRPGHACSWRARSAPPASYLVDTLPARLAAGAAAWARRRPSTRARRIRRPSLAELTGGLGADYVFDASGSAVACASAPGLAARGGSVTIIGWPEKSRLPVSGRDGHREGARRPRGQPVLQRLSPRDRPAGQRRHRRPPARLAPLLAGARDGGLLVRSRPPCRDHQGHGARPRADRRWACRSPLAGKVVIITGASSGIGAAAARELARLGCKVALGARSAERLRALEQGARAGGAGRPRRRDLRRGRGPAGGHRAGALRAHRRPLRERRRLPARPAGGDRRGRAGPGGRRQRQRRPSLRARRPAAHARPARRRHRGHELDLRPYRHPVGARVQRLRSTPSRRWCTRSVARWPPTESASAPLPRAWWPTSCGESPPATEVDEARGGAHGAARRGRGRRSGVHAQLDRLT